MDNFLSDEEIPQIDWPAYSPDLNQSNMFGTFWEGLLVTYHPQKQFTAGKLLSTGVEVYVSVFS